MSVDVEEYYHATIYREATRAVAGRKPESRIERCMERTLALLDQGRVRITFFILGEVAAAHPGIVTRVAAAGHEVACHGYHHELVSHLTPDAFRADLRRAKALLEDLAGQPVIGYRAPSFSIQRDQAWAHDTLLQEGFRYDSSLYPIFHDLYGDPAAPRHTFDIRRDGYGTLTECPIGTARICGVNFPIGGGGYFRLLPVTLTRWAIRWVNYRERKPTVFYFHPWELDSDQPSVRMAAHHRFRLRVGIRRMEHKLASLLRKTPFAPIREVFGLANDARCCSSMRA
jgi:polysaccharide deacetylase family protein (PEP-CTERM system associated)